MYTVVQNGDQVTITVKAKNNGSGIEPNAEIVLTIPSGLSLISGTPNKGTFDLGSKTWTIGQIKPGQSFSMDIVVEVTNLMDAPFGVDATISGDTIDPTSGNNTKTYTIEKVSANFNADAVDDANISFSFDLSQNDDVCDYCDTKWVITNPSVTNITILAFDQTTGKGEARLIDPTVDGTFQYSIVCYNCGDGVDYTEDTAMVTFPKLFNTSWIPATSGDVSVLTANPSGSDPDEYEHEAGGVTVTFDTGKGRITSATYNTGTGIITIAQKDGTSNDIDISDLLTSGEITGTSFPTANTLRITEKGGHTTDIDLSAFEQVTTSSIALQGVNNQTLRLTDSQANTVDGDISPIVVTGISVDESGAPTKVITLTFADGSTLTASYTDDTSSGGGDNWGSQVVQSDGTLLGDGTGGNLLGVDPAGNALVSNLELNVSDDLVLTLTNGSTITILNSALVSAINTDTTVLTNVALNSYVLNIQDDSQTWSVDFQAIIQGAVTWTQLQANSSLPTLTENGGNVTGFINLESEDFALTAPNDDNYVDGATYSSGTITLTRTGVLSDITIDISALQNQYNTTLDKGLLGNPHLIDMAGSMKHVEIIDYDGGSLVSPGIQVSNDQSGATLVIHNDEDEAGVVFSSYFYYPDLTAIGTVSLTRNTTYVFDVVANGTIAAENQTSNANILILRRSNTAGFGAA